MNITLHGIPNCDTVKRSRQWLADHGVACVFHDFRKDGVPAHRLDAWLDSAGWQTLLNRKGTTWRKLDAATQAQASDLRGARALMLAQPSLIKRPVIDWPGGSVTVGWQPDAWEGLLKARSGSAHP